MKIKLPQRLPGYTLLEFLIVIGIIAVLTGTGAAGITFLKHSVSLDNALRDLKAEIQSTQNNARNSFVAYQATAPSSINQRRISLGWVIEMNNDSRGITLRKRSVYFTPTDTTYSLSQLRINIVNSILNSFTYPICDAAGFKNNGTALQLAGSTVQCSSGGEDDVTFNSSNNANLANVELIRSVNGIGTCADTNTKVTMFFSSGYGEPVTLNKSTCQVQIRNKGSFANTRGLRVDSLTGSVTSCSALCLN